MDDAQAETVRQALDDRHDEIHAVLAVLHSYLEHLCFDLQHRADFYFRLVESRPKPSKSVVRALAEKDLSADQIWDIDDMLGCRVIVVTKDMAIRLRDELCADKSLPFIDVTVRDMADPDTGYRAIHVKGRYKAKSNANLGCEIQIRTALEDAWAFVSRMELYKGGREVPPILLQIARVESLHLQATDDSFDAIMKELKRTDVTLPEPKPQAETRTPEPPLAEHIEPAAPLNAEAHADLEAHTDLGAHGHTETPTEERQPVPSWETLLVLSPDDEFVLRNPVSPNRTREFLENLIESRQKVATTEMLFKNIDAFRHQSVVPDDKRLLAAGFNIIVPKGPFVEGSNWLMFNPWDFAVGFERHLLGRVDSALLASVRAQHAGFGADVNRDAAEILEAVDSMSEQLVGAGRKATLIVLTGNLGMQLHIDLRWRLVRDWRLAPDDRYHRILAFYNRIPILDIAESEAPGVYVVDLANFALLTRYGDEPEFGVEEFDDQRARALLQQNPRILSLPPPESGLEDARVRQLRLKVGLRVFETYDLEVRNPAAVSGRRLVGPIRN